MNAIPRHHAPAAPGTAREETAVVIGGGIVGVCCALYLQRDGRAVTLIDPAVPGDSTAKWSCGQMAVSEVIPLSKPGILMKVPRWLMEAKPWMRRSGSPSPSSIKAISTPSESKLGIPLYRFARRVTMLCAIAKT